MSRPFKILNSTLPRQSRRLDLALYRGVFILFVIAIVSVIHTSFRRSSRLNDGIIYQSTFERLSIFLLAILAGRLNRETVGDATSGYLSLIYLTGTSRAEWTLVRLFQIWSGFLSVWVIRLPFLLLFFTFGGAAFSDILAIEILLLFAFAAASSRTMLVAHHANKQNSSDWAGLGTIFLIEIFLIAGRVLITILSLLNVNLPTSWATFADQLAELSLYVRLQTFASGGGITVSIWWSVLIYSVLSIIWLSMYYCQLYKGVGDSPQPMLEGKKEKKKSLQRRPTLDPCWEDALAWQSYVYYAGGSNNTTGRIILYGFAFLLTCLIVMTGYLEAFLGLILVVSAAVLVNVMNTPAHCLDKETKAKTLSSLALTPNSGIDLYRGWKRGMYRLAIPDLIYVTLISVVTFFLHPVIPLIIVSFTITLLFSGPLLILSHLVPVSIRGFGTAVFVVFGLIAIFGVSLLGSWAILSFAHSFLSNSLFRGFNAIQLVTFLLVAIPLFWGFNVILLNSFVEKWMQVKIDAEA